MGPIAFGGKLTESEFLEMNAFATNARRLYWVWVAFLLVILAAWMIVSGAGPTVFGDPLVAGAFGLPLVAALASVPALQRYAWRRIWRSNKLAQMPVAGAASEDGITWEVVGISSARIPWSLLLKCREATGFVILFQGSNQVFCFPRRFFASDADWTSFRDLVRSKVAAR